MVNKAIATQTLSQDTIYLLESHLAATVGTKVPLEINQAALLQALVGWAL